MSGGQDTYFEVAVVDGVEADETAVQLHVDLGHLVPAQVALLGQDLLELKHTDHTG